MRCSPFRESFGSCHRCWWWPLLLYNCTRGFLQDTDEDLMWAGQPEAPGLSCITSHLTLAVGGFLNIFLHACTLGWLGRSLRQLDPSEKGAVQSVQPWSGPYGDTALGPQLWSWLPSSLGVSLGSSCPFLLRLCLLLHSGLRLVSACPGMGDGWCFQTRQG